MSTARVLLETERMVLRDVRAEDLEVLLELDQDPEVMRYLTKGIPTSRETYEGVYLPRMLSCQREWPPQGFWLAHLLDSGEFVGWFHLRPDKISPEEMELGYRLARVTWGRGLATDGSIALVRNAFTKWGYEKVSARTLAVNLASQRVMQKAGLVFECDFVYSAELWPEWTEEERRAVKYSMTRNRYSA